MAETSPEFQSAPQVRDEALYEAVFHSCIDGILISGEDGRYIDVNEAACQILGRTREELIGAEMGHMLEHPADARMLREKTLQAGTIRAEIAIVRPDQERRYLELTAVSHFHGGRHLLVIRDLTRRRNLDEQIRNASKMEAIGRLAGGVAHDFNNLLMVITSYTELMMESMAEMDPMRRKAQEVLKASSRAANLTRQLLAFSRKQVLDPQFYDLNLLIGEMSKLVVRVLGEDVKLDIQLGENLGKIYADRGQVEQILMHLAVNARDVMPEGGTLRIRTENTQFDSSFARLPGSPPPGEYVMLAVEDSGPGLSSEVLEHLFEPFFSTKGFGKGTGLGLPAVYGIVKQSGGYIWVDSRVGSGTRFHIYLPRVAATIAQHEGARPSAYLPETRPPVVLLVEDEAALRTAAADFLAKRGFKMLVASDGTEALSLASKFAERIDVLVTDLVMPGISGRVLAQELVKIHPETRILYMSGYSDSAVLESASRDAGKGFLAKPFRMDALSEKIRQVLGQTEQKSAGESA